jgi:Tfp pilus assembly protein PilV
MRASTTQRRARGTTLIEVMISMGLVLIGMLALFRVLVTSITGSAAASHFTQAELRAETLLETIRLAPAATLTCLSATASASWSTCGASYAVAAPTDRNGQRYVLDAGSHVTAGGSSGNFYDVTVVIGFSDDNYHTVAVRTGVYP